MNPNPATTEVSSQLSRTKSNGKPKRPLSAYNLFFQVERARILKFGIQCEQHEPYLSEEVLRMSNWHKVRPRRPHRKSHGRVSFQDMGRIITARWKDLDQCNRQVFLDQAKLEKADYVRRVKAWEAGQNHHQTIGGFLQSYDTQVSKPQHEQATTTLQHFRSNILEEQEFELADIAVSFPPKPTTALSFQTSTSSIDSLESVESLNLMNDDFFEVEISAEFHAEMAVAADNKRALVVPSASQPDCTETDVSSSTCLESHSLVVGDAADEQLLVPTATISWYPPQSETEPQPSGHSITVVNKWFDDCRDDLADVSEVDLMDALRLFDN